MNTGPRRQLFRPPRWICPMTSMISTSTSHSRRPSHSATAVRPAMAAGERRGTAPATGALGSIRGLSRSRTPSAPSASSRATGNPDQPRPGGRHAPVDLDRCVRRRDCRQFRRSRIAVLATPDAHVGTWGGHPHVRADAGVDGTRRVGYETPFAQVRGVRVGAASEACTRFWDFLHTFDFRRGRSHSSSPSSSILPRRRMWKERRVGVVAKLQQHLGDSRVSERTQ